MLRLLKQLIIPLFLKLSPLIFLKLNFELFPGFSKVKISLKPSFRPALKFWSFKEVENFEKKDEISIYSCRSFLSQITRRMNNIWFIQLEYWVLQFSYSSLRSVEERIHFDIRDWFNYGKSKCWTALKGTNKTDHLLILITKYQSSGWLWSWLLFFLINSQVKSSLSGTTFKDLWARRDM